MKLIDTDELKKKAVETFGCIPLINEGHRIELTLNEFLEDVPAIDAVPVVRCKDCVYKSRAKVNGKGFLICPASGMEITDNDFCSYGEKRIRKWQHEQIH